MPDPNLRSKQAPLVLLALSLLVSAFGLERLVRQHVIAERSWDVRSIPAPASTGIDSIYAGILSDLDPREPVGYLSDLPLTDGSGMAIYLHTRYALAPRLVLPDDIRVRRVVACVADASHLDGIERSTRLRLVRQSGRLAIFEGLR